MAEVNMDYQEKLQLVRTVLLAEWDPIGVHDEPAAQDEYDRYLPKLLAMLERQSTTSDVAQYLSRIATSEMGLVDVKDRNEAVAQRLVKLRLAPA